MLRSTWIQRWLAKRKERLRRSSNRAPPDQFVPLYLTQLEERRVLNAAVEGLVWNDLSQDGLQQPDEPGVGGAVVEVYDAVNGVIADGDDVSRGVAVTDQNGQYQLTGLTDGMQYWLEFRTPAGYTFSRQNAGSDDTLDSDADPTTGRTGLFTLRMGQFDSSLDAGLIGAPPSFGFALNFGDTGNDQGWAIAIDSTGNIYAGGDFEGTVDFDTGPGTTNLTSMGAKDIFVAKYTAAGALVWSRSMGGVDDDSAQGVAVDGAGNVYVTGNFRNTVDFDPGAGSFDLSSAGNWDVFVLKLDTAGHFLWAERFGGTQDDVPFGGIVLDSSSNIHIAGSFRDTVDFDPGAGAFNLTSAGSSDSFVSKLDTSGNLLWAKTMGGTDGEVAFDIAVDTEGNVLTTGEFHGTADFDPGTGTFNLTPVANWDVFVSKLDAAGDFVWARAWGGSGSETGRGIAVDSAGNVYSAGGFSSTVDFDPGPGTYNLTAEGVGDIFVSKLDAAASFVWARRMGGNDAVTDIALDLVLDRTQNVYTVGYFNGVADFDPGSGTFNLTSAGLYDAFISELNRNGQFVWAKRLGGSSYDSGHGIAVDATGNVYFAGHFQGTADFDPGPAAYNLTSAGSYDVVVLKLSPFDFGDAPAPYPTLRSQNGAVHIAVGPTLGVSRDTELDGQPDPNALGDDNNASDDEDGVASIPTLIEGEPAQFTVDVQNVDPDTGAVLQGWIDLDHNGTFDHPDEQFLDQAVSASGSQTITTSAIPFGSAGTTFVRFRVSTAGGLGPMGQASDGEVEDYQVTIMPGATTTVSRSGNDLWIQDTNGGDSDDALTIWSDTANQQFIISDPNNRLTTDLPGATGAGTNTITIPFSAVPGSRILVETFGGSDWLTVDFSLGNFSKTILYDGGDPTTAPGDSLTLQGGGVFADATFNFDDADTGSIGVAGNAAIQYDHLEPITSALTAANVTLNFSTAAESIAINDSGIPGRTTVTSTAGESVTFVHPTTALTINAGDAASDTVSVNAFGSGFSAALLIDGQGGSLDTVNLNVDPNNASLTVTAETINLNIANITTSGGQTYNGPVVLTNDVRLTDTGTTGIFLMDTVDSNAAARDLAVTTTTPEAAIQFRGSVGGVSPLDQVTITNAGSLNVRAAADFHLDGAFLQDGTGPVDLAGDVTTTGDNITFTTAVTLKANVTHDTGPAGGNITFLSAVDDNGAVANRALTLAAGNGTVDLQGDVGGGTPVASLTISSAAQVDLQDVIAENAIRVTGINIDLNGTSYISNADAVTLTGAVDLNAASAITVAGGGPAGGNVTFSGPVDGAQALTVNAGGSTTFGGAVGGSAALNQLTTDAGGTTFINGGVVKTSGPQTYNDPVTMAGATTLTGGEIDFAGGSGSVTGWAALTLKPATASANIAVGGTADSGAAVLDLTDTDLAALADGFSGISIGDAAGGSGAVTVDSATFTDPVTIASPTGAGSITVSDTSAGGFGLRGNDNASIVLDGSGATTTLTADIVTAGNPVAISDSVVLAAATVTIDTTDGGAVPAGASVSITGSTNADSASSTRNLIVNAGTGGDVTFGGAVGDNQAPDEVTIANANDLTFGSTVSITGALTETNGEGAATFTGAVMADSASITADNVAIQDTFTANGGITLAPDDAGDTIGIGDASIGTFQIDAAELNLLASTGTVAIGRSDLSGDVDVEAIDYSGESFDLKLNAGSGSTVTLDGDVTMGANNLTVDPPETIILGSDITAIGSGAVSLMASRNILMQPGSSIVTTGGAIRLDANQQAVPTSGTFVGIVLEGAQIGSSNGPITLRGRGGDAGQGNDGIQLTNASTISSIGTGTIDLVANSRLVLDGATVSGAAAVTLTAADKSGPGDDLLLRSGALVESTGSTVSLLAGDDLLIQTASTISSNGTLTLVANSGAADAIGGIAMDDGTTAAAGGGGTIDLDATDSITIGALTTTGAMTVDSTGGAILDTSDSGGNDLTASTAILNGAAGVGQGSDPLETTLSQLEADGGNSGVWIINTGDLEIGGISAQSGIAGNSDIAVSAASSITVSESIDSGGGNVLLDATGEVNFNASVRSGGGSVTARADNDITMSASGSIDTQSGTAAVTLTADDDGSGAGGITMVSGSRIDGTGTITLEAFDDVALSNIVTQTDEVRITSAAGAITDNANVGDNIDANAAVFRAATGIGTAADDIDADILDLAATTSTGDIHISDDAEILVITTVDGLSGVSITDSGASGDILIPNLAFGVSIGGINVLQDITNAGSGGITVTTQDENDSALLTVEANIEASGGDVLLVSDRDVDFNGAPFVSTTAAGAVGVHAGRELGSGGLLTPASPSGNILDADGYTIETEEGDIELTATMDVHLDMVDANSDGAGNSGTVMITADSDLNGTGAISATLAGGGANVTGAAAALRAATGIGSGNALETAISTLAAKNTSAGDIQIDNSVGGLLTIGTVDGLSGITNSAPTGAVTVTNASPVTIASDVINSGGGKIVIAAEGSTIADDLTIDANVTATGGDGNVALLAGDSIDLAGTATVSAAGSGPVLLSAGTVFNGGAGLANGTAAGTVTMHDGAAVASEDGDIAVQAPGDVLLATVDANSNTDAAAGRVVVTADFDGPAGGLSDGIGAISDNLVSSEDANIVGGGLALRAANGIGAVAPPAANLNTAVSTLAARTESGDIAVRNVGPLTIGTVDGLSGVTIADTAGDNTAIDQIAVVAASPLLVSDPVVNNDAGDVVLAAQGQAAADDLTINAPVRSMGTSAAGDGGDVTLLAGDSVMLGTIAPVAVTTGGDGQVRVGAGVDWNDGTPQPGTPTGSVVMLDGSLLASDDGDVLVSAPLDVHLSVADANHDGAGMLGSIFIRADDDGSSTGAIRDILSGEASNIVGNSAALSAAEGVGGSGAADINTQLATLAAENTSPVGGVFISNVGTLSIGTVALPPLAGGGTAQGIETQGGEIQVAVASDLNVDQPLLSRGGVIDLDSTTGSVHLQAGSSSQGGAVEIDAHQAVTSTPAGAITTTPASGIGADGGAVTIAAGAAVDLAGPIDASGDAAQSLQPGGSGGAVSITSTGGSVDVKLITSDGGAGGDVGGGNSGAISVSNVAAGSSDVTLHGMLHATGGVASLTPGSDGTVTIETGASIIDNDDTQTDIVAGSAELIAETGIAGNSGADSVLEADLTDSTLAATTATGNIVVADVAGGMAVGTVGDTTGVTVTDTAGGRIDLEARAGGQLHVQQPVATAGTAPAATIRLAGTGVDLSTATADVQAAAGPVTVDGNTGLLNMAAGSSVTTPADVTLSSDTMELAGLVRSTGPTGQVKLAPDTPGTLISLGNGAGAALALTDAELNTIEAPRVRIGDGTGAGPFGGPTTSPINFTGAFVADGQFATELLELRTQSTVTATSGPLDLSAPGSGLAVRTGTPGGPPGSATVDISGAAHNLNAVAVTTDGTDGSATGTDSAVTVHDGVDGLTVHIVDGLAGITTGDAPIRITTTGVNADVKVHALVSNSGSGQIAIHADDSVLVSIAGDVTQDGTGDIEILANTNGLAGDSGNVITMADNGAGDTTVIDAGYAGGAGGGAILLRTSGAGNSGGDITLGHVATSNTTSTAVTVDADGSVIDGGDSQGPDIAASGGGVDIAARAGIGNVLVAPAADAALEIDVQRLGNVTNAATGRIQLDEADDLLVDVIDQSANADVVLTVGGLLDELKDDNATNITTPATLVLSTGRAIGGAGGPGVTGTEPLDVDVGGIEAHVGPGAGGIFVRNADSNSSGLVLVDLDTASGDIQVRSTGPITAADVQANSDVTLIADKGDLDIDRVIAANLGTVNATAAAGAIREAGNDPAADVTGGALNLTAVTGIGGGGAAASFEVDATTVTAVNAAAKGIFLNSKGTGGVAITAQAQTAGDIEVLGDTEPVELVDLDTFASNIGATVVGFDLVARDVTARSSGDVTLSTVKAGNIQLDRVTALLDDVTLTAAEAVRELGADADADIAASRLLAVAGQGVGTAGNPIETTLAGPAGAPGVTEANGGAGGVFLVNQGDLRLGGILFGTPGQLTDVLGQPVAVTAAGGGIDIEAMSDLVVDGPVRQLGGGDIRLKTDGDLRINQSAPGADTELEVVLDGTIRGEAGGQVLLSSPANEVVVIQSATGRFTNVPAVVGVTAVDQGGSNVNSLGEALIQVSVGTADGFPERNFDLVVDWGDVPDVPVDRFRLPGNPKANAAISAPGQVDEGTHTISHTFRFGNPNPNDPAANIRGTVTVRFDPRQGSIFDAIEFTSGGAVIQTVVPFELTVPGEGLFTFIMVPESAVVPVLSREEESGGLIEQAAVGTAETSEEFVVVARAESESIVDVEQLYFTIVYPTGEESEANPLRLELLDQDRLIDLFKTFPNNLYKVYYKEAGSNVAQLLYELNVYKNKIVPPDIQKSDTPGQTEAPGRGDETAPTELDPNDNAGMPLRHGKASWSVSEAPAVAAADQSSRAVPGEGLRRARPAGEQPAASAPTDMEHQRDPSAWLPAGDAAAVDSGPSTARRAVVPHSVQAAALMAASLLARSSPERWTDRVDQAMASQRYALSKTARLLRRLRRQAGLHSDRARSANWHFSSR